MCRGFFFISTTNDYGAQHHLFLLCINSSSVPSNPLFSEIIYIFSFGLLLPPVSFFVSFCFFPLHLFFVYIHLLSVFLGLFFARFTILFFFVTSIFPSSSFTLHPFFSIFYLFYQPFKSHTRHLSVCFFSHLILIIHTHLLFYYYHHVTCYYFRPSSSLYLFPLSSHYH